MSHDSDCQLITGLSGIKALVLAGPGCGKTHMLAQRIIRAHTVEQIPFSDMVCLTFTNRASRQMNDRIRAEIGYSPDDLFVGNLHRFCCRLLRANSLIDRDICLIDEEDRDTWLARQFRLSTRSAIKQVTDLAMLLFQKENNFPPPLLRRLDFTPDDSHYNAARQYILFKKTNRLIDFDDLLLLSWLALASSPHHKLLYSTYRWVQVDEVQDLTPLQLAIIDMITADGHSTSVYLGDEQQAIFEFTGAGGPALDNLKLRCRNHIFSLSRNYRSPAYLVDLCNRFATANLGLEPADLPSAADTSGDRPVDALQLLAVSPGNLPLAVTAKVRSWHDTHPDQRIAVLTRTNDEAETLSDLMTSHGI